MQTLGMVMVCEEEKLTPADLVLGADVKLLILYSAHYSFPSRLDQIVHYVFTDHSIPF